MEKLLDYNFPELKPCLLDYIGAVAVFHTDGYWGAFDTRVDFTFILFAVVVSTGAEIKGQVFFFTCFPPHFFLLFYNLDSPSILN